MRNQKYIFFDCCRGGDSEFGTGKSSNSGPSTNLDTLYWYSTSRDYKAFERKDKLGSIFLTELYNALLLNKKHYK